jgi:hypothetical protein
MRHSLAVMMIFMLNTAVAGINDCPDQFTSSAMYLSCVNARIQFAPDITCSPADTKFCHSNYFLLASSYDYDPYCLNKATYIRIGDHYAWGGSTINFVIIDQQGKKQCP